MLSKKTDAQTLTETTARVETKESVTGTAPTTVTEEPPVNMPDAPAHLITQDDNSELNTTANELPNHRNINKITTEIIHHKSQIVQSFLEIGRLLIEAKTQLVNEKGHGSWLKRLSVSIDISERMAQRYMELAEGYANTTSVSDLGMTKALALLALPEAERVAFINEPHEVKGKEKKVREMSTREVKNAIREKIEVAKHKEPAVKPEEEFVKPNYSFLFKPMTKGSSATQLAAGQEPEVPFESSDLLDGFALDIESVQNHLDCILDFLGGQTDNPAIRNKFSDELRSLHKKTLQCMFLAKLETA